MPDFTWDIKTNPHDRQRYFWPRDRVVKWWGQGWDWEHLEYALDGRDIFYKEKLLNGSPFSRDAFDCTGTEQDEALRRALGGTWLTTFGTNTSGNPLKWDPFHLPLFDPTTGAVSPKHPDYPGPDKWSDDAHDAFRIALNARMEQAAQDGLRCPLHGLVSPRNLNLSAAGLSAPVSADMSFGLLASNLILSGRTFKLPSESSPPIALFQSYAATFGDKAEFRAATFGDGAEFRLTTFGDNAVFRHATFCDSANFEGARFGASAAFGGATFGDSADFRVARFSDSADFRFTTFGDNADFRATTFGDGAAFWIARFEGSANFSSLAVTGRRETAWRIWQRRWWCIDFTNCDFGPNPNFAGVVYDRRHLQGHFAGIGGAANIFGDSHFRRDVMDQDYIDTNCNRVRQRLSPPIANAVSAALDGFDTPRHQPLVLIIAALLGWLLGGFLGKDLAEVTGHAATGAISGVPFFALFIALFMAGARLTLEPKTYLLQPLGAFAPLCLTGLFLATCGWVVPAAITYFNWDSAAIGWGAIFALFAVLLVGLINSSLGRFTMFILWGWFDYGREWDRVLVFGAIMIGLFGWAYSYAVIGPDPFLAYEDTIRQSANGFTPWFAAAMGFATLGLTDVMTPLRPLGQVLMILNVLSGFFTLGLVLAVLGNTFARRA